MKRLGGLFILLFSLLLPQNCSPSSLPYYFGEEKKEELEFEVKGHVLGLSTFSEEKEGINEHRFLSKNRLRLDFDLRYRRILNLKMIADLELYAGGVARSEGFSSAIEAQNSSYWDFDGSKGHGSSLYSRQSLYRLYLTYESPGLRLDLGKQRLAWGVMRHFRPSDLFNPESPLQIQQGERLGIDGLRLKVPLRADDDLETVLAPSRAGHEGKRAAKLHFVKGKYDFSLLHGELEDMKVSGITFDGYIGDGGFRGELLRVDDALRAPYWMWTLGGDYYFPDNAQACLEYFNNGGNTGEPLARVNPLSPYQGIIRTKKRQFLSLSYSKVLNPLKSLSLFAAWDIDGHSFALAPRYTWNYSKNRELILGTSLFGGSSQGEYSSALNTIYLQLKAYF